ncbi:MAG: aryl-sulfate sulfotransferase [Planctomycetota bacterium]
MSIARTAEKGVTFHNPQKADDGYTLFSTYNYDVWLIDIEGYIVNRWRMPYLPGAHQVLLPNGNLLFAGKYKVHTELGLLPVEMAGVGGMLYEVNWDSDLVWKTSVPYQNHDIRPLENGHVLYPAYHPDSIMPDEKAVHVKGGLAGTEFDGKIWGDVVYEVDRDGRIVWEWKTYEHLDADIDKIEPLDKRNLWGQINSVYVCKNSDVLISLRNPSEVVRVSYENGKVLARYGRGKIFHQHDPRELDDGNILVFDNGSQRHEYKPSYSRIVELDPEKDEIVWEYKAPFPPDFYSPVCGGSERLPNGNTVICESWHGRIFEVTHDGELVWEYASPFVGICIGMPTTMMWRAHRYTRDYPGLQGKELDPKRFPRENMMYGPDSHKRHFTPAIF